MLLKKEKETIINENENIEEDKKKIKRKIKRKI